MTRTKSTYVALLAALMSPLAANATVIDMADVLIDGTSYRTFLDDTMGLRWLDLDNFWGPTDTTNSVIADMLGSGYHLATIADMLILQASIGLVGSGAAWTAMSTIVGGNYFGNPDEGIDRELIWGVYDNEGRNPLIGYTFQFANGGWSTSSNAVGADTVLETVNPTRKDLGAWVVSDAVSVPEPSTLALLGLGLAGMGFARRRRKI